MKAFEETANKCNEEYPDRFGDDQIILQILGEHHNHRRRGYGTALCGWQMGIAERDGVITSLEGGLMGLRLYTCLQFANIGECILHTPGEERKISFWAMVVYPRPKATL